MCVIDTTLITNFKRNENGNFSFIALSISFNSTKSAAKVNGCGCSVHSSKSEARRKI